MNTKLNRKIYRAKWYQQNRERVRESIRANHYLRKFNLTIDEYSAILLRQDSVCKICKQKETAVDRRTGRVKNMAIDHCHTTGKIRGLLCTTCNTGLGAFRDSPELLNSAIKYLKERNDFSSNN